MLGEAGVQYRESHLDDLIFIKTRCLGVSLSRAVGFLRGTLAVVILVKGHAFPTILKVRPVDMDSESAHMVAASKVPMLKPGEFELWRMRIEQYIQMIDYALWEVIENGNTTPKTTVVEGVEKVIPPTTAEEKAQKG
ncbi:hypothetical protein Tco_0743211 [Tanacetum coccineum]